MYHIICYTTFCYNTCNISYYHTISHCTTLRILYTTPHFTTLYYTTPYYTTPHHIVPHHTTPPHATLYHTILHHPTPHCTTPYHTMHTTLTQLSDFDHDKYSAQALAEAKHAWLHHKRCSTKKSKDAKQPM